MAIASDIEHMSLAAVSRMAQACDRATSGSKSSAPCRCGLSPIATGSLKQVLECRICIQVEDVRTAIRGDKSSESAPGTNRRPATQSCYVLILETATNWPIHSVDVAIGIDVIQLVRGIAGCSETDQRTSLGGQWTSRGCCCHIALGPVTAAALEQILHVLVRV